jgi:hypothetical protein
MHCLAALPVFRRSSWQQPDRVTMSMASITCPLNEGHITLSWWLDWNAH